MTVSSGPANNGISSQDASRIAQYAAGLITLTDDQLIAADASGNGTVNSQDAARVAQFAAGISVAGMMGQSVVDGEGWVEGGGVVGGSVGAMDRW